MTATSHRHPPRKPWYREPWPWLLMSGPAIVVVAGIATAVIAFRGADGLVADDYYKQGLTINRQIARDQMAQELGISGELRLLPGIVRVSLRSTAALPDRMTLRLVHPARASEDRVLYLARTADGAWEAPLAGPLPAVHWRAIVETARWRVAAQFESKSAEAAAFSPGVR
ncbi:MAG TPA: FixH family protein [Usitatibacteraceae bacterium]|nr:FixH family protein [Usitatibacteraceae bacterium]